MNAVSNPQVSIEAFEAATIDPDTFDHEAHVYIAWQYLEKWPFDQAIHRFRAAIKRLTVALGAETKYHETVTWFFLVLINERRRNGSSWHTFRRDNTDLVCQAGPLLRRYYRDETLASDRARQTFVLPDRISY